MREKLLFVTKGNENFDEGFCYVLDLAKTLNAGIAVLMIYNRQVIDVCEDLMAAAAFAEAGEHGTMQKIMYEQEKEIKEMAANKINEFIAKCKENSVPFIYEVVIDDTITAIKEFLKNKPDIDMILLSPNLSGSKKILDFRKLLKNITKPVVAMSMPAKAEA